MKLKKIKQLWKSFLTLQTTSFVAISLPCTDPRELRGKNHATSSAVSVQSNDVCFYQLYFDLPMLKWWHWEQANTKNINYYLCLIRPSIHGHPIPKFDCFCIPISNLWANYEKTFRKKNIFSIGTEYKICFINRSLKMFLNFNSLHKCKITLFWMSAVDLIFVLRAVLILVATKPQSKPPARAQKVQDKGTMWRCKTDLRTNSVGFLCKKYM